MSHSDHIKELLKNYGKDNDCKQVILHVRDYERHLIKLIKALITIRLEAHYLNLIIDEDREIAHRHNMPGFWERKTCLVIKGYNVSFYAHATLMELQSVYPELFTLDGFQILPLPQTIDKQKG